MNLIIDAGNSQIKWAIYSGKEQIYKNSVSNWNNFEIDSIAAEYSKMSSAILSSVRKIPLDIYQALTSKFDDLIELDHTLELPISNNYHSPQTLGKDRIAAAVGGAQLFPGHPVLIIDMGTAITIDFVSKNSEYLGGNISPGMNLRFKALEHFTDGLPLVSQTTYPTLIGRNTTQAIQSGVQLGIIYELEAYINTLINKYNELRVILTGGDASVFVKNLKNTIFVVPDLVMDGLNTILEYQKKRRIGINF